jgi:acetylornithine/succinyldiaminopimelate/putrescine aminotransferase
MVPNDPLRIVQRHLISSPPGNVPVVRRLTGALLEDADGVEWLDAAGGGFGAGHVRVRAAIAEQASRVALSSRQLISRPLAEAVAALADFCPGPLCVSYLCNSGDEALDSAFKLAKGTHPTRRRVLGISGESHGNFLHGRSLTDNAAIRPGQPLAPVTVPRQAPETLLDRVDESIAAVVISPAAAGRPLRRLPQRWWVELRERCHSTGALLVLDERQTGPARLGASLGSRLLGIHPDVLVLGETLGADAVPVGVAVTTREAYLRVYGRRNPTLHGSTFGANPLSAAAISAVLDAVHDDLPAQHRQFSSTAQRALNDLSGADSGITEACADGSLIWLRTVDESVAAALAAGLAERRVLVNPPEGNLVRLIPPLTIGQVEFDDLMGRLAEAIKHTGEGKETVR